MPSRRTAEVSWQWQVPPPPPAYSPPTQLPTSVCGEVSWTRSDSVTPDASFVFHIAFLHVCDDSPCSPGDRHSGLADVCPGSGGPEEQSPPWWSPAGPGGSSRAGNRRLDGLQQRLRPQPSQGFGTSTVHVHRRLGSGCFQVSGVCIQTV